MSSPRQDRRTPASNDWGKRQVNYPDGLPDYPEIVETLTASQSKQIPAALSAHPDTADFPSSFLTKYHTEAGENRAANWWLTYETLPGPVITEDTIYSNTGIPILVSRQKVAATAVFQTGEIVPAAINVQSITAGSTVTVVLASDHGLPIGAYVTFAATNSIPAIDGTLQIVGVPASNSVQVTPASTVVTPGTVAGTMQATNRILRQLQPTDNANVKVKVESMIAAADVSVYNESVDCWKDYDYPDFNEAYKLYIDQSQTQSNTTQGSFALAVSTTAAAGIPMQVGYRGASRATRLRYFFSGPPPASFIRGTTVTVTIASPAVVSWTAHGFAVGDVVTFSTTGALPTGLSSSLNYYVSLDNFGANSFRVAASEAAALAGTGSIVTTGSQSGVQTAYKFAPTFIMPSAGTIAIEGLTLSISSAPGAGTIARGHSNNWKMQPIRPALTGPSPTLLTILPDGSTYTPANIASIAITGPNASATEPLITTSTPTGIPVNTGGFDRVILRNTGTTPSLDGIWTVAGAISTTSLNIIPGFNLSAGSGAVGTLAIGNQAQGTMDLPQSIPPKLNQGDIITEIEQPQKADVGALWFYYVWRITVPYTSGQAPL